MRRRSPRGARAIARARALDVFARRCPFRGGERGKPCGRVRGHHRRRPFRHARARGRRIRCGARLRRAPTAPGSGSPAAHIAFLGGRGSPDTRGSHVAAARRRGIPRPCGGCAGRLAGAEPRECRGSICRGLGRAPPQRGDRFHRRAELDRGVHRCRARCDRRCPRVGRRRTRRCRHLAFRERERAGGPRAACDPPARHGPGAWFRATRGLAGAAPSAGAGCGGGETGERSRVRIR